jgi:hypothetical protein
MMLQTLIPGMEHAEEADLRAKVPGIASDLKQGLRAGLKQEVIHHLLVLQGERSKLAWQCEDDMHVGRRQQLPFTGLQPTLARVALALGTVSVTARVVRDGSVSAVGTAITMAAERSGAAARDRQQDLLVLPVDPALTMFKERLPSKANDIGHLQWRPVHELCVSSPCVPSVRESSGLAVALRCRLERCR